MLKRGFTLLEMMLVIIVLGIGLFPLVQLFSNGIVQSSDTTKSNLAVQLAQEKVEQFKNTPYTNIISTGESLGSMFGFAYFSREAIVNEVLPNLKDITVKIYWGSGRTANSFSVRTYISNY